MNKIMKGFPIPLAQRVPIQDWDRAPWNRWTFQNVREVIPTTEVWRGNGATWDLTADYQSIGKITFASDGDLPITIRQWLDNSYTDGFLVMHHGRVVFERYMNHMTERSLHLSQSMAKSVTGAVAGILIGKGILNPDEPVTTYLPELQQTGWRGATLQQVMDMTTGVRYTEDYEALDSDIAITDIASGWKRVDPNAASTTGIWPSCVWDQILTLTETTRPHGERFEYRSIESDVMAHCMERVTQTRLAELISRELWQPLGCERERLLYR